MDKPDGTRVLSLTKSNANAHPHVITSSFVTSIIRLRYVTSSFSPTADLSWDTMPVIVWSLVEEVSGVVCINLPPCRGLFGRVLSKTWFSTTKVNTVRSGAVPHYGAGDINEHRKGKGGLAESKIVVTRDYAVYRDSESLSQEGAYSMSDLVPWETVDKEMEKETDRLRVKIDGSDSGLTEAIQNCRRQY